MLYILFCFIIGTNKFQRGITYEGLEEKKRNGMLSYENDISNH